MQLSALLGLEVLTWKTPRGPMASHPVLVSAPLQRMLASVLEIEKLLAAETVLGNDTDRPLHTRLGQSSRLQPMRGMRGRRSA
jgi:hypothetical protein